MDNLDLTPPYERLTLAEAFERHAGVDLLRFVQPLNGPGLQRAARDRGIHIVERPADEDPISVFEHAFYAIMLARVEPAIGRTRPTFLYEWPAPLAALSRISEEDPRVAERVKLYAGGLELGNGCGELTDVDEQLRRFTDEQQRRKKLGKRAYAIDQQFLSALRKTPPSCGMAVGLDRMVMLCAKTQRSSVVERARGAVIRRLSVLWMTRAAGRTHSPRPHGASGLRVRSQDAHLLSITTDVTGCHSSARRARDWRNSLR